jgi:hypothetical protein
MQKHGNLEHALHATAEAKELLGPRDSGGHRLQSAFLVAFGFLHVHRVDGENRQPATRRLVETFGKSPPGLFGLHHLRPVSLQTHRERMCVLNKHGFDPAQLV